MFWKHLKSTCYIWAHFQNAIFTLIWQLQCILGFAQKGILKAQWSQYKCFRKQSEQISYQSEKQEPSSDKRKADGRWDMYLWTAERTSFFFIFPPTLEAISNAPDLDIWQKQTNPLQDRWKWNQCDEIEMKLTDFYGNDWENEEITVRCLLESGRIKLKEIWRVFVILSE